MIAAYCNGEVMAPFAIGRVNMIAAYCNGEVMAPFAIEGACNRVVFET